MEAQTQRKHITPTSLSRDVAGFGGGDVLNIYLTRAASLKHTSRARSEHPPRNVVEEKSHIYHPARNGSGSIHMFKMQLEHVGLYPSTVL